MGCRLVYFSGFYTTPTRYAHFWCLMSIFPHPRATSWSERTADHCHGPWPPRAPKARQSVPKTTPRPQLSPFLDPKEPQDPPKTSILSIFDPQRGHFTTSSHKARWRYRRLRLWICRGTKLPVCTARRVESTLSQSSLS